MNGQLYSARRGTLLQRGMKTLVDLGVTSGVWMVIALWLVITVSALTLPIFPIDETRYISVAWEMWIHHSQWVSLMNGQPYSDKPPLLFWLMEAGWEITGVNRLWPMMISPLCSLLACFQLFRIARQLGFSEATARFAQIVLLTLPLWSLYSQLIMFDVLLTTCILGAIEPLTRNGLFTGRHALTTGIWLGLALLAKGPVAFVTFLPIALSISLWRQRSLARAERWWIGLSLLISIAMLLGWALTAAKMGGTTFAHSLLWGQTVHRMHGASAAHARPDWWYLGWLPLFVCPWLLWIQPRSPFRRKTLTSILFWWLIPSFVIFSLISGKQVHYVMPLMPALALFIAHQWARFNDQNTPEPGMKHYAATLFVIAIISFGLVILPIHSLTALAPHIHRALLGIGVISLVATLIVWTIRHSTNVLLKGFVIALTFNSLLFGGAHLGLHDVRQRFDLSPVSHALADLQQHHHDIAYLDGDYQATFQFSGRLVKPLTSLDDSNAKHQFIRQHPTGWVLGDVHDFPSALMQHLHSQQYAFEGKQLVLVPVKEWTSWNQEMSLQKTVTFQSYTLRKAAQ